MSLNRVLAIGRDTYIRAYPNPGVGVCVGSVRVALSWYGGLELFRRKDTKTGPTWVRQWSFLSRIKRPGGK